MTIPLGGPLQDRSSNLPVHQHGNVPAELTACVPIGFAPGGVYHAALVANGAVRSYCTLSPLPE